MSSPVIIIPVFNAFDHVQDCLASLNSCSPGAKILVIDDASTDRRVPALLRDWVSADPSRELLENSHNRGFVFSVNRGIAHVKSDVVLLNSDTLVSVGWLDALAVCLASDRDIATATPWTNNGEIVSFPVFCEASAVPDDVNAIAAAFKATGRPGYPELPTAVGFCMAISRRAIDRVGLFDEETFGRGYGEENDFCLRAVAEGMRNVLCDNAYVAHAGGASFGPAGLKPDKGSMGRLLQKHPEYEKLVHAFIQRDPLAQRRNSLIEAVRRAQVPIG